MQPSVSAFRWVPPFAQGLVRDLRVRWALHEAQRTYQELLIGSREQSSEQYRQLQPFGQVPAYVEDQLHLFESGAIVLHISESSARLLPTAALPRSRAKAWMFAALNSVEPPIMFLSQLEMMKVDDNNPIHQAVTGAVAKRLTDLSTWLGERPYLEGEFTAGDLLMTTVLRILRNTDLLEPHPTLRDYQHRCEEREAFKRALDEQLRTFRDHKPP